MYCSKCGVQNSDGVTQCPNCGGVLGNIPQPQGVQASPAPATEPKTCGLAIAAFVMSLLSMTCVLWPLLVLPAVICGLVALVKINGSKGQLKGFGFAVSGLVIPVIFTFIVPVLLAILMPALSQVKKVAQSVVCGTNLQGLSVAMRIYADDYDGELPAENWCDLLTEKVDVAPVSYICASSDAIEGESCYAMNINIAGKNIREIPSNAVLFFETDKGLEAGPRYTSIETRGYYQFFDLSEYHEETFVYKDRFNQLGGPEDLVLRHERSGRRGCNIAFVDGHTEYVTEDQLQYLLWKVE